MEEAGTFNDVSCYACSNEFGSRSLSIHSRRARNTGLDIINGMKYLHDNRRFIRSKMDVPIHILHVVFVFSVAVSAIASGCVSLLRVCALTYFLFSCTATPTLRFRSVSLLSESIIPLSE